MQHPVSQVADVHRKPLPATNDIAPTLPAAGVHRQKKLQKTLKKSVSTDHIACQHPIHPSTKPLPAKPVDRSAEQIAHDIAFIASRMPKAQPLPKYSQERFPAQPLTTSFFRPTSANSKPKERYSSNIRYNSDIIPKSKPQRTSQYNASLPTELPPPTRDELPNAIEMQQYQSVRDYGLKPTHSPPKVIQLDIDTLHNQASTQQSSDHIFNNDGFFTELMDKLEVTNQKLQLVLNEVHRRTPVKIQQQGNSVFRHEDIDDIVINHNITPRIERTVTLINQVSTPSYNSNNDIKSSSFITNNFHAEEVDTHDDHLFEKIQDTTNVELDMSIHSIIEKNNVDSAATAVNNEEMTTAMLDHGSLDDNNLNIDDESWSAIHKVDVERGSSDVADEYEIDNHAQATSNNQQALEEQSPQTLPTTSYQRPLVDNRHDTDSYNFSDMVSPDVPISGAAADHANHTASARTFGQQLSDEVWQSIADKITIPIVRNNNNLTS